MERKIFFTILVLTLVALAIGIMLPGGEPPTTQPRLPWKIEINDAGLPAVFGITLGETRLQQLRDAFQEQGKLSLFVSASQQLAVEVYFKNLYLSGIKADLVAVLRLDETEKAQIYDRGLRISKLESGARQVRLAAEDELRLKEAVVEQITYIPGTDLDADLLLKRFGEPAEKITESSGIEHWLYPDRGLDIGLNAAGKEVFQYLIPNEFERIVEPLRENQQQD